jgi:hypothetical protein
MIHPSTTRLKDALPARVKTNIGYLKLRNAELVMKERKST